MRKRAVHRSRVVLFAALNIAIAALGAAQPARATGNDSIEACVSASRRGQQLQRDGKLRDARATLVKCAEATCPAEVRSVCEGLLSSVETSLPTVVLGARDENGQDLFAVRVLSDDAPLAPSLDGKSVAVDPGPHVLRFTLEDGRSIALKVLIREAEKNRPLTVAFERAKIAAPTQQAPTQTAPQMTSPTGSEQRGAPVLAYAFGGLGIVALGTTLALGVDGQHRYDTCKASPCSSQTVDALSVERAVTWVTLGVGLASVGAGVWLWISRPSATSAKAATSVAVGFSGTGAWAAGTF